MNKTRITIIVIFVIFVLTDLVTCFNSGFTSSKVTGLLVGAVAIAANVLALFVEKKQ